MPDRDRPSIHGSILGEALADLEKAGRVVDRTIPESCATCAFREGSMPNQMASTGIAALHCVLGTDPAPFGCHHGMEEGMPKRMCAGYAAARKAPWEIVKATVQTLNERLKNLPEIDTIRTNFDTWARKIDPDNKMDDYARARAYAKELSRVYAKEMA